MSTLYVTAKVSTPAEARTTAVLIGELPEDRQVTTKDTGWSEEEKERMRQAGYDGVDMINAWYG
ncbi:MAG: hypothetical protein PHN64_01990 [Desulfovibrionaceae bacterium]|jgi:hypothetical protein|nr:hypothetical protein [Desulfovibrionaceae bacterium]